MKAADSHDPVRLWRVPEALPRICDTTQNPIRARRTIRIQREEEVLIWWPHLGQVSAVLDISASHSRQCVSLGMGFSIQGCGTISK